MVLLIFVLNELSVDKDLRKAYEKKYLSLQQVILNIINLNNIHFKMF